MKLRYLLTVAFVLCLFIGGWIYLSWPMATFVHTSQTSNNRIPLTLEQMLKDWNKPSPEEIKRRNIRLAKEIARLKKTQKVVNGMVEVRQDELPKTIVAGERSSNCYVGPYPEGSFFVIAPNSAYSASTSGGIYEGYPGWNITSGGIITIPDGVPTGDYYIEFHDSDICPLDPEATDLAHSVYYDFQIIDDLTGSVSVSKVSGLQACIDLKADASEGQKVVSVDVDWDDGSSHYTTSPNTQHYFGSSICHTYASAGSYTITATYHDDDSHTIHPDTKVTVDCINSASMSIESSGSSNGKNPANGVYTYCYTSTVSHSTAAGESYSYDWTFPANTTVNSGGGSSDQTASFCIATTNISAPSNFGVVSCEITKTTPTPPCDVTVSGQLAGPGGPPSPPPAGPPPGDAPPTSGPLC